MVAVVPTSEQAASLIDPVLEAGRSHQFSGIKGVMKSLRELCQADGCVLWLWTEQGPPDDSVLFAAAEEFIGMDGPLWHYLSGHSPTTRAVREGVAHNFSRVREDAQNYDDLDALLRSEFRDPVRLIPNFDVYLAGRDRRVITSNKEEHKRVYRQAGWVSAVVLARGKVGGVWSAKTQKDKLFSTSSLSPSSVQISADPLKRRLKLMLIF